MNNVKLEDIDAYREFEATSNAQLIGQYAHELWNEKWIVVLNSGQKVAINIGCLDQSELQISDALENGIFWTHAIFNNLRYLQ